MGLEGVFSRGYDRFYRTESSVLCGKVNSSWARVTIGVLQGSVLFIKYINDLMDKVMNVAKVYADDTKILANVQEAEGTASL
jgi:hypothetical protein